MTAAEQPRDLPAALQASITRASEANGPTVHASWLLGVACHGNAPSRDGFCGGLNGSHAEDCPAQRVTEEQS